MSPAVMEAAQAALDGHSVVVLCDTAQIAKELFAQACAAITPGMGVVSIHVSDRGLAFVGGQRLRFWARSTDVSRLRGMQVVVVCYGFEPDAELRAEIAACAPRSRS